MNIKYLKHIEIDKRKWDECISTSSNRLIFAFSIYLDVMCPGWEAIVINDYDSVFALPVKRKFGVKYLYIPSFIPQLGLFGSNPGIDLQSILKLIKSKVKYGDIFFNYANHLDSKDIRPKTNFVLHLGEPYETIHSRFTNDLKKNLRKERIKEMVYSDEMKIESVVKLYKENYSSRTPNLTASDYKKLIEVCNMLASIKKCFTRSLYTIDGNVLCCQICFKDKNRIYTIINPSTQLGRKKKAAIFLYNEMIKEFNREEVILDFVGSDLPGVKSLLKKFGPENEPSLLYHYNNLPYPLRFFKRI